MATVERPQREVRADYTDSTITVYQAYSAEIAEPALEAGTFVSPFKRERMTWIKPSLLWMAYRSGWGGKASQERVLAVEITREGFDWALDHASLSHFDPDVHDSREQWQEQKRTSPVRVQWDPERDLDLCPLGHRSIQIGLGGSSVRHYVDEWIVSLTDITETMHRVSELVRSGQREAAVTRLPDEAPYPLADATRRRLGASPPQ